jgi:hypothetical protein
LLPSEFKANWDDLIKDKLPSTFTDFLENPIIYLNIIQDLVLIVNGQTKNFISKKNKEVCRLLNIPEKQEQQIYKQMINIYQDCNTSIFKLEEEFFAKVKEESCTAFKKIIGHKFYSELATSEEVRELNNDDETKTIFKVNEQFDVYIDQLMESDDFTKFIGTFYQLCLFMNLNDPPLKLPLESFSKRKYQYRYFHKNDLYCIDGFAKENAPSLVILPPVMRNNFPYKGIRPAVLIMDKETVTEKIKEKMEEIELEEKSKNEKKNEKDSHFQDDDNGVEKDPFNCTSNNTSYILNESVMKKTLFQTTKKVFTCDKEISVKLDRAESLMPSREMFTQTDRETGELEWFSSFCPLNDQLVRPLPLVEIIDQHKDSESLSEPEKISQKYSLSFHRDELRENQIELPDCEILTRNVQGRGGSSEMNSRKNDDISEILAENDDYSIEFARKSDLYGLNKDHSPINTHEKNNKVFLLNFLKNEYIPVYIF